MQRPLCALLLCVSSLANAGLLDKYVGTYALDDDFKVWMRDDGGQLYMLAGQHPCYLMDKKVRKAHCPMPASRMALHQWVPMTPRGDGVFTFDAVNIRFEFKSNEVVMIQKEGAAVFAHPLGTTLHLARKSATLDLPPMPKEIKLGELALKKFVGTYQANPNFDVLVKLEGGHLTARPSEGPKFILFPESPNHFFIRLAPMELTFEGDQIRWFMNGTDSVLKRQPEGYVAKVPPNTGPKACRSNAPASLEHGTFLAVDNVKSAILGQTLPICVYLPPGYADHAASYPVIYQTDGEYMESTIALLERKKVQAVVFGLGGFEEREINLIQPGAEKYFRFMVEEVMPQLEARYRVDPKRRILNGHSMGGNFVLVAALLDSPEQPHFVHYLSTDGSFTAASYELHALMDARRAQDVRLPATIVLAGAGHGNGVDVRQNYERLRRLGFRGLHLAMIDLVDDDHNSVALAAANEALDRFFPLGPGPLATPVLVDGLPKEIDFVGVGTYLGDVALGAGRHTISAGGLNETLDVPKPGAYVVRISANKMAALALRGAPKLSRIAAQPIYLRGSMNDWGIANPMRGDGDRYAVTLSLKSGQYEFKVGSEDFQTVDFGALAGQQVFSGADKTLVPGGANVALKVEGEGSFTFTLDASKPYEPTISVRRNP
ncbi:MAG: alpha/beta hydrolase-fold protein [Pseudomonadota bacterium]